MAVIQIKDLSAPGSMLFSDLESYLNELTEDELVVSGGAVAKREASMVTLIITYSVSSWTW
jgi:hypothetical protein